MFHRSRLLIATCVTCWIAPSWVIRPAVGQLPVNPVPIAAVMQVQPAQIAAEPTAPSGSSDLARPSGWGEGFAIFLGSTAMLIIVTLITVGSITAVICLIGYQVFRKRQLRANLSRSMPSPLQTSALAEQESASLPPSANSGSLEDSQRERSPHPALSETTRLAKVDIVEALMADLQSHDPVNRRKAIWELGQRGDSRAMQPLVDLLMDSDSAQRSLILAAVSEIGVRSLKPMNRALMLSIQDDSPDVRKNAIRDVTHLCDLVVQVSQLLQYAASDTDPEVRETAHWALSQLSRIRSAPEERPEERLEGGSAASLNPAIPPSAQETSSDGS